MNVIIKNQNNSLSELQIDIIKTLEGEFSKEDIEREFINFYYNKVIVDITSIKNYYDFSSLFNFLSYFEPNRIIILLNDSDLVNSKSFLAKLVEKGYYNFTRNISTIAYLIEKPNTYEDVSKYLEENNNGASLNIFNSSLENINEQEPKKETITQVSNTSKIIIGITNLTPHAGATTLMYMLVKQLNYENKARGIEMLMQDSIYFKDNNITCASSKEELQMLIKTIDANVIVVDLNGIEASDICTHILYLIEPGVIKLNKLIKGNNEFREKIKNGKVILNRSAIKNEEMSNFEYETKLDIFFNIPNFNERKERIEVIDKLILKLNINVGKPNKGFFGLFN